MGHEHDPEHDGGPDPIAAAADLYAVLGVPATASTAEITRASRRLVRRLHPDLGAADEAGGSPPRMPPDAEELRAVLTAYRVLRDPGRRAAYDGRVPHTPPMPGRVVPVRHRAPGPAGTPADPAPPPVRAGPVRWHGPSSVSPPSVSPPNDLGSPSAGPLADDVDLLRTLIRLITVRSG